MPCISEALLQAMNPLINHGFAGIIRQVIKFERDLSYLIETSKKKLKWLELISAFIMVIS
jgi:hypothetical protein